MSPVKLNLPAEGPGAGMGVQVGVAGNALLDEAATVVL